MPSVSRPVSSAIRVIPARFIAGANRAQVSSRVAARRVPSRITVLASSGVPANVSIEVASLLGSTVVRQLVLVLIIALVACGGTYAQNTREAEGADRGETNGRSFEFVSNKPEGDDWSIRIRDTSMSVG